MNKHLIVLMATLLTSSLYIQGMLVNGLVRNSGRVTQQVGRRHCQTTPTKRIDADFLTRKANFLQTKYGIGMGMFLNTLPLIDDVLTPKDIDQYLDTVNVYASHERTDAPTWQEYKAALAKQQQKKE